MNFWNRAALKSTCLLASILLACAGAGAKPQTKTLSNCRVVAVASNQMSVDVMGASCAPNGVPGHVLIQDPSLQTEAKQLHAGDVITLVVSSKPSSEVMKVFSLDVASLPMRTVGLALLVSALVCFLFYYFLAGLHPLRLAIGEDGRYSNSKFQIALWFGVLITTYIATVLLRRWYLGPDFCGGVNIPPHLLLISGMSAFTFAAAKGITTSKANQAHDKGIADPKNSAHAHANFLRDLTHNDMATQVLPHAAADPAVAAPIAGAPQLDLGDFQMTVVTLLAVAVYFCVLLHFLCTIARASVVTIPDVDTTILAAFGLGHGAYLAKKAAGNVGES